MNQSFYDKLTSVIAKERVYVDEPMSRHTTFRVGGPADYPHKNIPYLPAS